MCASKVLHTAESVDLERISIGTLGRWRDIAIVAAILLLASAFRLQDVNQPLVDAFSWREASTAMIADNFHNRSWNVLFPEVSWTGPGPSYQGREFQIITYITALLYVVFGWHDWLGRLVAIAFGIWGVFALHRLIDRTWGRAHAHAGALMLAIMPGAVFIDRSFLPDPAMLALITTGFWLYVDYLQKDRPILLVGSTLLTTLGILAKLPGICILLPMAYATFDILIGRNKLTVSRVILLFVSASIVILFVFGYYRWATYLGNAYPPYHVAGSGYLWDDGFSRLVREDFYLDTLWNIATNWLFTLPTLFLIGVALLAGPPRKDAESHQASWIFHIWLGGAAIVYVFAAREVTTNPWNFHVFNVPAAAFAGRGLFLIADMNGCRPYSFLYWIRVVIISGSVAVVGSISLQKYLKAPFAMAGYELGLRLNELSQEGELVVTAAPTVGDPVAIYYSRRRGWVFPPGGGKKDWSILTDDTQQAIDELEALRANGADWFGMTKNARDSKGRLFLEHHRNLISHLDLSAQRVVNDDVMIVYRLSRPPAPSVEPD